MATDGSQKEQRIKANYAAKAAPCRTLGVYSCETTTPAQLSRCETEVSGLSVWGARCRGPAIVRWQHGSASYTAPSPNRAYKDIHTW